MLLWSAVLGGYATPPRDAREDPTLKNATDRRFVRLIRRI